LQQLVLKICSHSFEFGATLFNLQHLYLIWSNFILFVATLFYLQQGFFNLQQLYFICSKFLICSLSLVGHRRQSIKSNYISKSRDFFGTFIEASQNYFGKSLSIDLPLTAMIRLHLSEWQICILSPDRYSRFYASYPRLKRKINVSFLFQRRQWTFIFGERLHNKQTKNKQQQQQKREKRHSSFADFKCDKILFSFVNSRHSSNSMQGSFEMR